MPESYTNAIPRILVIDDNPAIHEDFKKILAPRGSTADALAASEAALFGEPDKSLAVQPRFDVDHASQGADGAALVSTAQSQGKPYALAFVDMRMPPGWDGIETTAKIWELDPAVQIVICTAYSDHSWDDVLARLGRSDQLVILKKPFDNIEVLQLASALTQKWRRDVMVLQRLRQLEALVGKCDLDLGAVGSRSSGTGGK